MGQTILRPHQEKQWMDVLSQTYRYDFYHLPRYHAMLEEAGDESLFLVFNIDGYTIGLPIITRQLSSVPGLQVAGTDWKDATSVYGYSGPVSSHNDIPDPVLSKFRGELRHALESLAVVSLFTRLHPLIEQKQLIYGLGESVLTGRTVSIDLTLPIERQRALYGKSLKYGINKAKRAGIECILDEDLSYLDEFVEIYTETMSRVGASEEYFFDKNYFTRLFQSTNRRSKLFVSLIDGKLVNAGVFTHCDNIVQFHLSGTRDEFLDLAPTKVLLNTVRLWAVEQGAHVLHLGGGVGSKEDSLFHFKASFSPLRHEFMTWRWVVLPDVYDNLCERRARWDLDEGLTPATTSYFPLYRSPVEQWSKSPHVPSSQGHQETTPITGK